MGAGVSVRDEGDDLAQCGLGLGICIAWREFRARSFELHSRDWDLEHGIGMRSALLYGRYYYYRTADRRPLDDRLVRLEVLREGGNVTSVLFKKSRSLVLCTCVSPRRSHSWVQCQNGSPLRSALPRGPSQPEQDSDLHHNPCAKDRHVMFDITSR